MAIATTMTAMTHSPSRTTATTANTATTVGKPPAIGEHENEPGALVRRREVTVQERLEIAIRGRDPGPFLDLEDELPPGCAVGPRGDAEDRSRVGQPTGDGFGDRGAFDPGFQRVMDRRTEPLVA